MTAPRASGVLLHPTSLPGAQGIGTLGADARRWIDFLADAGQRYWQVMPLGPTGYGDSPYQCFSAFAGNPYLLDLDALVADGLLTPQELEPIRALPRERVAYGPLIAHKVELLSLAAERFAAAGGSAAAAFEAFCRAEAPWLDDYAAFMALKEANGGGSWTAWPEAQRLRDPEAMAAARAQHARAIDRHKLWQHWFFGQWSALRAYANERGVRVIGDIPIFVALDSADTWAQPELYHFDADGQPTVVAGVPPDYFSATGQRWGNPLYRWKPMAASGFAWWVSRVRAGLRFFDRIRLDHFRGFEAYWEIPASEPTAERGRWVRGPGQPLFDALKAALGSLPIIAEDLGVITPGVEALRDDNDLPGMRVLQFAFGGDAADPYLPHNYPRDCVVYTGTHDNDTTVGWYAKAPEAERDRVRRYLGRDDADIAWELVRLAQASVADLAMAPLQDLLSLGSEARMNTPGTDSGNWGWRFAWDDLPPWLAPRLREMGALYGRWGHAAGTDTAYRQSVMASAVQEDDAPGGHG